MADIDNNTNRGGGSRTILIIAILAILAIIAAFAFGLIDIDQKKGAELPTVEVDAKGGQLPTFDVDTADVDVGTTNTSVEVPTVEVNTKKTNVEVPTISVDKTAE